MAPPGLDRRAFLLAAAAALPAGSTYTVGVEDFENFLPYSEYRGGRYDGLGRALLDAFAAARGISLRYVVLPIKRRDRAFADGELDLRYPDNPAWVPELRRGRDVRYAPMLPFIDGVLVRRELVGRGLGRIKVLGVPLGFTPFPFDSLVQRGVVKVDESPSYDRLYDKLLAGRVDGAYMNTRIAAWYWKSVRQAPNPLAYDPALPHADGFWYLSSMKYPGLVDQFRTFLATHAPLVAQAKARYGFE